MPIYEYRCESCGAEFEKLIRREGEEKELVCPVCNAAEPRRKISLFAAGSGCGSPGSSPFR